MCAASVLRRTPLVSVVKTSNLGNLYHVTVFGCLDRARLRRVLLQGQMRSGPVIVAQISFENHPYVEFAEHNDRIKAISPQCSDHSFRERILPWTPRSREDLLNAYRFHTLPELFPADPVMVPNQKPRCRSVRKCLDHLFRRPQRRGMFGHVEVHYASTMVSQNNQHK